MKRGGFGQGPRTYRTIGVLTEFLQKLVGAFGATLFGCAVIAVLYGIAFIIKEAAVPALLAIAMVRLYLFAVKKIPQEYRVPGLVASVAFSVAVGSWAAPWIWAWVMDLGQSGPYLTIPFLVEFMINFSLARNAMQLETADSYWPGETQLRDPKEGPAAPEWLRERYYGDHDVGR